MILRKGNIWEFWPIENKQINFNFKLLELNFASF